MRDTINTLFCAIWDIYAETAPSKGAICEESKSELHKHHSKKAPYFSWGYSRLEINFSRRKHFLVPPKCKIILIFKMLIFKYYNSNIGLFFIAPFDLLNLREQKLSFSISLHYLLYSFHTLIHGLFSILLPKLSLVIFLALKGNSKK